MPDEDFDRVVVDAVQQQSGARTWHVAAPFLEVQLYGPSDAGSAAVFRAALLNPQRPRIEEPTLGIEARWRRRPTVRQPGAERSRMDGLTQ
jgi:hypothetical protein